MRRDRDSRRTLRIAGLLLVGLCGLAAAAPAPGRTPAEDPRTERAMRLLEEGHLDQVVAELLTALDEEPERVELSRLLKQILGRRDLAAGPLTRRARWRLRELARDPVAVAVPEGEPGDPLIVRGTVRDEQGRPIDGALVYIYQADVDGLYTRLRAMDEPNARLFALMRTGPDGRYEFRTVLPGHYPERKSADGDARFIPRHIHFEISAPGRPKQRHQMVFSDDPRMTAYWREWAEKWGNPIADLVHQGAAPATCVHDIVLGEASLAGVSGKP